MGYGTIATLFDWNSFYLNALFRAPVKNAAEIIDNTFILNIIVSEDEIIMYQCMDKLLARKIRISEKAKLLRTYREKGQLNEFVVRDGLLYRE